MVYRRRRRGRSMYSRRRRYFGRGYSQTNTSKPFNTTGRRGHWKRLKFPGRIVMGNEEVKFFDGNVSSIAVPRGADVNPSTPVGGNNLLTITQGVSASQRIGRKINVLQILFTLTVGMDPYTSATWSNVLARLRSQIRFMIVIDRQCNGIGVTGLTDFLTATSVTAFNNLYRKGRFKTLRDKNWNFNHKYFVYNGVDSAWETDGFQRTMTFSLNLNGLPIEYNSTTGAVAEIMTNNIFFVIYDAYADATIQPAFYLYRWRVRYIDA